MGPVSTGEKVTGRRTAVWMLLFGRILCGTETPPLGDLMTSPRLCDVAAAPEARLPPLIGQSASGRRGLDVRVGCKGFLTVCYELVLIRSSLSTRSRVKPQAKSMVAVAFQIRSQTRWIWGFDRKSFDRTKSVKCKQPFRRNFMPDLALGFPDTRLTRASWQLKERMVDNFAASHSSRRNL